MGEIPDFKKQREITVFVHSTSLMPEILKTPGNNNLYVCYDEHFTCIILWPDN